MTVSYQIGQLFNHARTLERELNEAKETIKIQETGFNALALQRDRWKQCAEELAKPLVAYESMIVQGASVERYMEARAALATFNQLKQEQSTK